MPKLPIAEVKEGCKVSLEVVDAKGNVLIKAGTLLSQQWIDRLKSRGVEFLEIEDASGTGSSSTASMADLESHLKMVFMPVLGKPHMKALARATYLHFKGQQPGQQPSQASPS
ncbi:MAG: hypothetical protein AB7F75_06155 [Planctomycetota bacterium]